MKTLEEIKNAPHICAITRIQGMPTETYGAAIDLFGFQGTVIFGFNEDGWEHVSVSHSNKRILPTWEDMCRIKDLFWNKNETVVQIHPSEKQYVHGVGAWKDSNVLHLWRPVNAEWQKMEEEFEDEGRR